MSRRLIPAALAYADGVPYAAAYGDVYHSADGGLEQARHVFLGGNDLPRRWRDAARFTLLETGFGLGLNFLATWQAWQSHAPAHARLHYVAIEKHPFAPDDLARLHARWPELAALSAQLRAAWPPLVPGFHRVLLDGGRVTLTLAFGDIADCLPQIAMAADAFYLDGFAPSRNPDMWSPQVLSRLHRLAAPGATAATYTVSAAVRQALAAAGFACEKRPGFGRKRDMLAARYAPRWPLPPARPEPARRAVVIGAGVAGSAVCARLAARGWQLTLVERHEKWAAESSGNLAGIAMPLLSRDDNIPSRLARAAFLFSTHLWQQLGGVGSAFAGEACGVLQLARDAGHAALQRETVEALGLPPDFARFLGAEQAAAMTGNPAAAGGWLFPRGGWVTPSSLCEAMLASCGGLLERRFAQQASSLRHDGSEWTVQGDGGACIARAPVVVIASGTNAASFAQTRELPLAAIRGQVTHIPAGELPSLPVVLCGEAYVTRPANGICCVGATYDIDTDPALRQSSQDENLERLAQVLPQTSMGKDRPLAGRTGFRAVSPDRLPLVGALPDPCAAIGGSRLSDVPRLPGMHAVLGLASRGIIWAPFAAELLASQLEGEPLPVERELAAALDPARFALKAWRRRNG
ncbi:bifunctional tRNA (5-methylaminomethyl-2-thiouridine)(34)-methyltransferase MnmD/FAD-dependent 5-carboxymethylaminomethyl-2-thiouridine(34) oxidoreductase MnmC [Noviherbaspirillum aridicola]|uniref:tRNA 5-methylaminomethyl-2-thiouridine biosynthesis bifunctional protein MnmC n=1 Tax=Noviherbaspirillum aridicola TaxID=2849687 RepID=A0ABQ4Q5C2_9BURK|nr:bifunctional tRNA (5-methylaminomethyl-2-thiouridine)(34)-methyltransferase MnmD/FAD-dependent 5-carboxymethylaminomethyl-2-thiouridine(34) oxidoreductase MnmC [Noviherbaspirillum aridicola]GIZ52247.1 tRNA 5-methylaminomethyl-2-thiouridine biosynthesis bifunctional protein MnmC [Noviherbaspirillum aridicola]